MRSTTILLAIVVLATAADFASAADSFNTTFFGHLAVEGYDPVAYFTDGVPTKGSKRIQFEWMGANWRFASTEHLAMFQADPERYAPQYGGYCAWAVSQGDLVDIDPEAWRIVDGKLYLNYSKKVQKMWEEDIEGNVAAADAQWPKLRDGN